MVHTKECKSCNNHDQGSHATDLEILHISVDLRLLRLTIHLWVLYAKLKERIQQHLCHKQRCEHGKHNTKHQCNSESLDTTGTEKHQYNRRNQSCDISIQDCRKCFGETCFYSRTHTIACGDFLTDTCKDDDIRIYRHTD